MQCSELSALTRSPHTCSQAYIHKLCKCAFVFYFYLFIVVVVVVFNIGKYAKKKLYKDNAIHTRIMSGAIIRCKSITLL